MAGRQTRGRQRIPIQRIENQDDLYATFSKRRIGLYKKASELSTLCGVDIGMIIFSPTDNPFSFFSPSMESVVERYRNPNQPLNNYARVVDNHTLARIEHLNQRLDEILEEKKQLKEREKQLDEIDRTRQKGWWEQVPVESLNKEQVQQWKAWFQDLKAEVKNRIEELENGGSTSTAFQPDQNAPPPSYASPSFGIPGPGQFPTQYHYFPPHAQHHIHGQFYVPPQVQDPFAAGGSSNYLPTDQYNYIPGQEQDPSTNGRSGDQVGPSHLGNIDP